MLVSHVIDGWQMSVDSIFFKKKHINSSINPSSYCKQGVRNKFNTFTLGILLFIWAVTFDAHANSNQKEEKKNQEEVIVVGNHYEPKYEATVLTKKLMQTAGTFGDPLQAVFSLPGIVQVDEEDAEPAVQGSSPNANLFLIDDIPAKFLFHFFGNSIFNENLIHDFGFNAAGFGARYGQATGAVFNVSLRDPKNKPLETTLDLSFLRIGGLLEGGITKNQSFYLSYRESLLPFFIEDGEYDEEDDFTLNKVPKGQDYQGKYFWRLSDNSSLTFLATGASDKAAADLGARGNDVLLDPGLEGALAADSEFNNQSLKWLYNNTKLVLGHSNNQEFFKIGNGEFLDINEDAFILKAHQSWAIKQHMIMFGAEIIDTTFNYEFDMRLNRCSDFSSDACDFDRGERVQDKRVQEITNYDVFIEDIWAIKDAINLTLGIHGSSDSYLNEASIDPRVSMDWNFMDEWTLNTSIGRYHQMPDESEILPVVGNPELKNTASTHYVLGLAYGQTKNWKFNTNIYYKDIKRLIVGAEEGDIPYLNEGQGKAYGVEFMISKELTDRWYGWTTISYSQTHRTNNLTGKRSPFSYHVPIVINNVVNYQLNQKWNIGTRWTYRTGTRYTPITGNRQNPNYPGFFIPIYGDINSNHVSDFHRLDIRFERSVFNNRGTFYIDIINAYNRNNSSGIEYVATPRSSEFRLRNIKGYGTIPSIGLKVRF